MNTSVLPFLPRIEGIEFVEYATRQVDTFGALLQAMGFVPVARHRSRQVLLYRQGNMNVILNAHPKAQHVPEGDGIELRALGLRVPDAEQAYAHALACEARPVATRPGPMELNIPGIQGPGGTAVFLLDRRAGVAFYQVDFLPLPGVSFEVPALAGLHLFGVVQYIQRGETARWCDFFHQTLGFEPLPDDVRFGVMPRGALMRSSDESFFLQFVEAPEGAEDAHWQEGFTRIGLGAPDVAAAVAVLEARGIQFVDASLLGGRDRGALTRSLEGGIQFELVHHQA